MSASWLWTLKTVRHGGHRYIPNGAVRRRAYCKANAALNKARRFVNDTLSSDLCHVQIFRSIASDCVMGLWDAAKNNSQAYNCGLVTGAAPAFDHRCDKYCARLLA